MRKVANLANWVIEYNLNIIATWDRLSFPFQSQYHFLFPMSTVTAKQQGSWLIKKWFEIIEI